MFITHKNSPRYYVMQNEEKYPIAIIQVNGREDITDRITQAVREHLDCDTAEMVGDIETSNNSDQPVEFKIVYDDEDEYTEVFTLIGTVIY